MSESVLVTLRADVNQVDETGYAWAFLSDADEPVAPARRQLHRRDPIPATSDETWAGWV